MHLHHIVERADGGDHDPDNLIASCARHHLHHVHRLGWRPSLDPENAVVTWRRPGRETLTTVPHGPTGRPPPRLGDELPDWLAPPIPAPPTDADDTGGLDPPGVPPEDPPPHDTS